MPLIREAVVTTVNTRGEPHIAPLGLVAEGEQWISSRFTPQRRWTICVRRRSPSPTLPTTCASSPDASPAPATGR